MHRKTQVKRELVNNRILVYCTEMKKNIISIFTLFFFAAIFFHTNIALSCDTALNCSFDHQHPKWAELLEKHVRGVSQPSIALLGSEVLLSSTISYKGVQEDEDLLDSYLAQLKAVTLEEFQAWSDDYKLAFLANAYNAFTVKLILNHYPLHSIMDIESGKAWKIRFFKLLGMSAHLDYLEQDLARNKKSGDGIDIKLEPRLHFMFNCASIGCPALQKEPFLGDKLEEQMERATLGFLQDGSRNRYDKRTKTLHLSKIFKWYGGDFGKSNSAIKAFVAERIGATEEEKAAIRHSSTRIRFLEYNWTLNEHTTE